MNFAVFVSGHGSNLQALIDACRSGRIPARLALVVSDKKDAYALQRAREANIQTVIVDPKRHADRVSFDREAIGHLKSHSIDFVVLAGFMRILSGHFIKTYPGLILNIHPSLLPQFKGARAIKDAFAAGVKETGVTVHFVVEDVDAGPIILQEKVMIRPDDTLDTLEQRIHDVEHRVYPEAVRLFAEGGVSFAKGARPGH